jgi:hypothetical protein
MKRALKSAAKACWRLTGPARRPLGRKLDAAIVRCVSDVVHRHTEAIRHELKNTEHGLNLARHEVHVQGVEANLTLDSLVREIGRLQMQIEVLHQMLVEREAEDEGLSIVAGDGRGPLNDNARARVG